MKHTRIIVDRPDPFEPVLAEKAQETILRNRKAAASEIMVDFVTNELKLLSDEDRLKVLKNFVKS